MRKQYKLYFGFLLMVCILFFFKMPTQAAEIVDKGTWGDNITWTFDDEGTLTISGKGKMKNGWNDTYVDYEAPNGRIYPVYSWKHCLYDVKTIVIGKGITNIPMGAFCLPNYLQFSPLPTCPVENIKLPLTIVEIGHNAFANCKKLKRISIPSSVKKIQRRAFYNCEKLKNVNIPYGIKIINESVFHSCKSLKKIKIPETVVEIGKRAFAGCTFEEIVLPKNLKIIRSQAFAWCEKLKTIEIPSKVKSIGSFAFQDCTSLETVTFKSNKNKTLVVANKCFYNCTSLKTVVFPNNVKELRFTFKNCSSLESVKLPKNLEVMTGTFSKCTSLEKITIPAKVKQLDDETFYKCKNLKKIVIKSEKLNFENAYKPHVTYKGIAKEAWILIPASKYDLYKKNIMLSAPETVRIKGR